MIFTKTTRVIFFIYVILLIGFKNCNTYAYQNDKQEITEQVEKKLLQDFVYSDDSVNQQAWQILQYTAYLDQDFISIEIIKELFLQKSEPVSQAIKKLESVSLISVITDQKGNQGLRIRQKLQNLIRISMKNDPEHSLKQEKIIGDLLSVLNKLLPELTYNQNAKGEIASKLQPQVEKLLKIETEEVTKKDEFIIANLYYKLAMYYQRVSINYKKALEYAKISLQIRRKLYTGDNPDTANSISTTGVIYLLSGNAKEGVKYLEEGLAIRKRLYKGNHPKIADSLISISRAYRELGENKKCLEYAQMSLKMNKELYLGNHYEIADSLNMVGRAYLNSGEFKQSLVYFKDSLQMLKALYTGSNIRIAIVLDVLSYNYSKLGNYKEALKNAKVALAMDEELYPNGHPHMIYDLHSYGIALIGLNKIDEGITALRQALDISEKFNMEKHFITGLVYCDLGIGYFRNKEYQKALKYAEKALNLKKELYSNVGNHQEIVESLDSLGDIYLALDNKIKALELYKQALEMSLALSLEHLPQTKEIQRKFKELNDQKA